MPELMTEYTVEKSTVLTNIDADFLFNFLHEHEVYSAESFNLILCKNKTHVCLLLIPWYISRNETAKDILKYKTVHISNKPHGNTCYFREQQEEHKNGIHYSVCFRKYRLRNKADAVKDYLRICLYSELPLHK